jgi:CRISPR/Cas system-associated exonuclease Cas4 (RecB family)
MSDDWTVSASKIKSFTTCEEQFRLRYVEGHDEMGPPSRWIRRGNAVHEAVEAVLSEGSDPNVGSDLLKGAYNANGGPEGYLLDDGFHEQVLGSLDAISRFLRKHADGVRGVEVEVEFGVEHATVPRDFGGYMDLATESAVVDWKTGKSEGKEADEAIQGAVYMGGYAHEYGEPPEAIHFAYVNPDAGDDHPKTRTIEPDDDLWDEMIGKTRRLLDAVESGEFTADPGPSKCHFCDHSVFCSADPVGGGGIPWEVYP